MCSHFCKGKHFVPSHLTFPSFFVKKAKSDSRLFLFPSPCEEYFLTIFAWRKEIIAIFVPERARIA